MKIFSAERKVKVNSSERDIRQPRNNDRSERSNISDRSNRHSHIRDTQERIGEERRTEGIILQPETRSTAWQTFVNSFVKCCGIKGIEHVIAEEIDDNSITDNTRNDIQNTENAHHTLRDQQSRSTLASNENVIRKASENSYEMQSVHDDRSTHGTNYDESEEPYDAQLTLYVRDTSYATPEDGKKLLEKAQASVETYQDTADRFHERYSPGEPKKMDPLADAAILRHVKGDVKDYSYIEIFTGDKMCYKNYVNLKTGSIICVHNYKNDDRDMNKNGAKGEPLDNSEILWHTCRLAANKTGFQLSQFKLTEIVRCPIRNRRTVNTVNRYMDLGDGPTPFQKGTEEWLSIIATDNCKSSVFFAAQHAKDISGNPEVKQLIVNRGDDFQEVDYIKIQFEHETLDQHETR